MISHKVKSVHVDHGNILPCLRTGMNVCRHVPMASVVKNVQKMFTDVVGLFGKDQMEMIHGVIIFHLTNG